jgi:L-alanine-DL-glutamate epimerase-like enolase superfamily enzyme
MRRFLIGEDPIANERIWDILKRSTRIGHRGHWIVAIAAVDHALWDIRGKAANMPVHRLLGGPTRSRVPTYVSALGRSLEPENVFIQAQEFKNQGFPGQKWFFKYGPGDGPQGMAKNLLLVRTLREAVGDDYPLMFDCFMGWDVLYSIEMCRRMESYNPHWLEEPLQVDRVQGYAEIRRKTKVPIAGGEHESTRWGFRQMLDCGSVDVLQPDPYGVGGISEMIKIAALASTYDKIMCPHCGGVEFVASQPPSTCPFVEYLYTWWEMGQWFRKYPVQVERGHVIPCEQPGLGNDINWERVLSQEEWIPR